MQPASGKLPLTASLLSVEGDAVVSAVKPSEDGEGIVVRVYNPSPAAQRVRLGLRGKKAFVSLCDGLEKHPQKAEKDGSFVLEGYEVAAVRLVQK